MLNRYLRHLALTVLCASVAFSQQPAPQPTPPQGQQDEALKVSTAVVQLDVIVTDKTGRRVTGLDASDFQVTDDNTPRPVDYFTAIERSRLVAQKGAASPGAASPGATAAAAPPVSSLAVPYPARHIALVVDDQNLSIENFTRMRRALTDYVNTQLSPDDMVALISTGGSLSSLQQFTNDKQRVLAAISRIATQGARLGQVGTNRFNLTPAEAVRIDSGDDTVLEAVARRASTQSIANEVSTGSIAEETSRGMARGSAAASTGNVFKSDNPNEDPLKLQIRNAAKARVSELGVESRRTLKTLANLFHGMAELPGRKIAVMLTESFSTLGGSTDDQTNDLNQLIDLARRSGISIYGLDAAGLRTDNVQASQHTTGSALRAADLAGNSNFSDFEKLGALRALVSGTGGTLFANTNDIVGGLQRAVEDASSYYVVGFTPSKLDNRFHLITIAVKGRPELVVRTRRGYLAANQETMQGTNAELASALISPIPRIDLPVEVVARAVPQGAEQVVVTGIHVGRNYLQLPPPTAADQTAAYEVVAWVFGAGRDEPTGVIKRTLTYDLSKPEERQKLKTSGVVFVPQQPFKLSPGLYQIRVAMREKASGAVGSAYQFFEVPDVQDKKALSVSSLLVNAAGQTTFGGTNSFAPGAEIDLRFIIYNPPKDAAELTQRVRLLDAQGRALLDSPLTLVAAPANGPSMALQSTRFKLPPARGRYALIVNLLDKKGKVDVERRADLVIE
ncbi:MAG TPA: VWA domain-containing protein [Pyrinomonadaceae bacterium]|jgi:VWFA-related protein